MNHLMENTLPNGWHWITLSSVATVQSGAGFPKRFQGQRDGAYPFSKVSDISNAVQQNNGVLTEAANYVSERIANELNAKVYPPGSTLFAKIGEAVRLNRRAIAKVSTLADNNVMGLIPNPNVVDPKFLFYFTHTVDLYEFSRATTVPSIRKGDVQEIPFPIPPMGEQQRIVAEVEKQFTRLDATVANLRRLQQNLDRYRASVLKAAFEGRLVSQDPADEPADQLLQRILAERRRRWEEEEWQKQIERAKKKVAQARRKEAGLPYYIRDLEPEDWEDVAEYEAYLPKGDKWKGKYREAEVPDVTELELLPTAWVYATTEQLAASEKYSLAIGPFGSNLKVDDYRDEGVPLVFVRNIRSGVFEDEESKYVSESKAAELRSHWTFPGDVLITKMGDPPGDACIYPDNRPPAVITADCVRWKLSPKLIDGRFFVHAIHSEQVHRQILKRTRGVAQLKISLGRFKTVAIPLPPLNQQTAIADEVDRRLSIARELEIEVENNLMRADRLRQSILEKAFTGRLVAQDPNDESAEKLLKRIRPDYQHKSVQPPLFESEN